ncbi:response regulator [Trinickia dinghuensis]|nr:response regulator [Trinickia dinghuensis]
MLHPVSVVFLDDNADFLDGLRGIFRDRALNRFFTRPQAALEFLSARDRGVPRIRIAGAGFSQIEAGSNALGRDALSDGARFEEVAAVVVDYEMPEIDGIRFLSSIEDVACAKILLTGAAGYREAVDAFNAGLIDLYLTKGDTDMTGKLATALAQAKKAHCRRRGHIGVHGIGTAYSDPRVVQVLDRLAARENLVEYYWRPDQNAVLMFDAAGNPSVFTAWDADEWEFQRDTVTDAGGPEWLRRSLEDRSIMPLFWPHQAYRPDAAYVTTAKPIPIAQWEGAFYSLTPLDASEVDAELVSFAKWRQASGER